MCLLRVQTQGFKMSLSGVRQNFPLGVSLQLQEFRMCCVDNWEPCLGAFLHQQLGFYNEGRCTPMGYTKKTARAPSRSCSWD